MTYTSEADLVSQTMEAPNAHLRVANVKELGEAKALASTSGGIDDGLGSLDLTETRCEAVQELVISGGVKTTNVDIAVAGDAVLQALVQSLHLSSRSEDGGDSLGDRRLLLEHLLQVAVNRNADDAVLGSRFNEHVGTNDLLGRWSGVSRTIESSDSRALVILGTVVEWSRGS